MQRARQDKVFQCVVVLLLTVCALTALVPFALVLLASLTEEASLTKHGFRFFPRKWSGYAYEYLFRYWGEKYLRACGVTAFAVVCGTALHLLIAPLLAWPLTRRDYPRRHIVTALVVFPLALSGGVTPSYLLWGEVLHLKNTLWAYLLPNLVLTPWQVLLYRQAFRANLPQPLLDAARLDGAGEWRIYRSLVLPLSAPAVAAVCLFVAVGYYDDWINPLYYITDTRLYNLQILTNTVIHYWRGISSWSAAPTFPPIPGLPFSAALSVLLLLPYCFLLPVFSRICTRAIRLGVVKLDRRCAYATVFV